MQVNITLSCMHLNCALQSYWDHISTCFPRLVMHIHRVGYVYKTMNSYLKLSIGILYY